MGKIIIIRDLLDAKSAVSEQYTGVIIDYLQIHWPQGFNGAQVSIFFNGKQLAVEDYDKVIGDDDYATIVMPPGDPITLALMVAGFSATTAVTITTVLTNIALALVASVITSLFMPKPKGARAAPRAVYSISAQQNQPALGSPIPEHFGKTWFLPTYASQPYSRFANGEQFLYQIMLIGAGKHQLHEIRLGTTSIDSFPPGTVTYNWLMPEDHGGVLGNIEASYGISEDVVTSSEVQDIDFGRSSYGTYFGAAYADDDYFKGKEGNPNLRVGDAVLIIGETPSMANHNRSTSITSISGSTIKVSGGVINDAGNPWYQIVKGDDGWRGWYETTPPLKKANRIEVDFIFPNGIFRTDNDGDYRRWDVYIFVEVEPIDDSGNSIGTATNYQFIYSAASANPKRVTESISIPEGRYRVRAKRDDRDDARQDEFSKVHWVGLKAFCTYEPNTEAYGEVTLLLVTMQASRALADAAAGQLTCLATRILPTLPSNFTVEAPTVNPVDAFAHIVRTGAFVDNGLELAKLNTLHAQWENTNGFNWRFDDQVTVYEALQIVAAGHRATPQAYAKLIGMRPDRAQEFDKFLITAEQMLIDSYSLGIKLGNDTSIDSYRVEYTDPKSPSTLSVIYPLDGAIPETVNLYGCTDKDTAIAQAKYLWTKRNTRRRIVECTTEFDSHCFSVGDRIAILHPLMDWITTTRVISISGQVLTLDGTPINQGVCKFKLRSEYGEPSELLTGVLYNDTLIMNEPAPFQIYGVLDGIENTTVVLGTETTFKRSYTVSEINPSVDSIQIKGIGYDGSEYQYQIPGEVP